MSYRETTVLAGSFLLTRSKESPPTNRQALIFDELIVGDGVKLRFIFVTGLLTGAAR